jgi:hypothetical protein
MRGPGAPYARDPAGVHKYTHISGAGPIRQGTSGEPQYIHIYVGPGGPVRQGPRGVTNIYTCMGGPGTPYAKDPGESTMYTHACGAKGPHMPRTLGVNKCTNLCGARGPHTPGAPEEATIYTHVCGARGPRTPGTPESITYAPVCGAQGPQGPHGASAIYTLLRKARDPRTPRTPGSQQPIHIHVGARAHMPGTLRRSTYILPHTAKNKTIPSQTVGRAKIGWAKKAPARNGLRSGINKLKQTEKRTRQTTPPSHGHTARNRPKCGNYISANGENKNYTFPNGRKGKNRLGKKTPAKNVLRSSKNKLKQTEKRTRQNNTPEPRAYCS